DGSGAIDCIYHIDLEALTQAIETAANRRARPEKWSPKVTFDRMLRQGRIRDYDDLLDELLRVPTTGPSDLAVTSAPYPDTPRPPPDEPREKVRFQAKLLPPANPDGLSKISREESRRVGGSTASCRIQRRRCLRSRRR